MFNKPPVFTPPFLNPVLMNLGDNITYNLPNSFDPEGLNYEVKVLNGSSLVTVISKTQLRINATNCGKDLRN